MKHRVMRFFRLASTPTLKTKMLAYLLLLSSIPVAIMGIVSAYSTSKIIRGQAVESNAVLLKQTEKELNLFFKKIDDLMLQYTYASSTSTLLLKRFVEEDLSVGNWKTVMDLSEILVKLQSGMEHVLELDFYSVPYGKILSSRGNIYTEEEFSDPTAINEAKKLTYSNRFLNLRMSIFDHETQKRPVLTIIKPILQNNHVNAALIVYLDAASISSYKLAPPAPYEGSSLFVTDEQGNIILHSQTSRIGTWAGETVLQKIKETVDADWIIQDKLNLDGFSSNTVMLRSESKNWYYFAAVPEKAFTTKVNTQRNVMLGISLGLASAGLLVGYRASRVLYRPLQQLTNKLKPTEANANLGSDGDEVVWLDRYLERLSLENKQLSKEIGLYYNHAKHFLLHQLLVGNMPHQNILLGEQETFSDHCFFIPLLIVDLNRIRMMESYSQRDCSLYYYAVDNIAMELLEEYGKPQVIMIQPGMFVTIVPMENRLTAEELRGLGRKLQEALLGYLKLNSFIAVSYSETGTDGLHEAYEEASSLLRCQFLAGDNQVMLIHDLEASVSMQADVLFHSESEIAAAIRLRQWNEAEELFQTLADTLQESFHISEDILRGYFPQLLGTIIKSVRLAQQNPFDAAMVQELLLHLAKCRTLEEVRSFFRNRVFAALRQEYEETGVSSERILLVEQVQDYIHKHYDTDLSLQQCAEQTGLTPFDLSRMFKQVTGVNFIDYLIEFRMEKAKLLLTDPNMRIQDITDKLRYSSMQGFMRAFKKSTGMTPGQYRSKLNKG
ncbi:helix-turn-helix domain-containing protein [Paenibacillus sp. YN15]|uniref:helix-turn-helix domain-containing protein n=1 Tax=Paenibacillus sp. YN15 TaxID=1742774 RepID=UPI0015EC005E|nr:helix-turn-helix domain-containing protein [Paenibacillus sp. YN15]